MNPNQINAPASGIKLVDIVYVIFRHKWKITSIALLGLVAALGLYLFCPLAYQSRATLFIKYVLDTRTPTPLGQNEGKLKIVDDRGEAVIGTELAILQSWNLAQEAARKLPLDDRKRLGGSGSIEEAAVGVFKGLRAEVAKRSSVIELTFEHKDKEVVRTVLEKVIIAYTERHQQIHRPISTFDDSLRIQNREVGKQLETIELQLMEAKAKAGVLSLEDARKIYTEQLARLQDQIFAAEAELDYKVTVLSNLTHGFAAAQEASTNQLSSTNTAPAAELAAAPPEKVNEYKRVLVQLETLLKREQELLVAYTPGNALVKSAREQIQRADESRKDLEQQYPTLVGIKPAAMAAGSSASPIPGAFDIEAERAQVAGLQSRINALRNQLALTSGNVVRLATNEPAITRLQRQKEIQEANYKLLDTSYQQSEINKNLEPGTVSNISTIQDPSPAQRDTSKLKKIAAVMAIGSIVFAFALAFLIDFYLDQSIKRPMDVETRLGLPLFISIPELYFNGNGKPRALLGQGSDKPLLAEKTGDVSAGLGQEQAVAVAAKDLAPWNRGNPLQPFYEALRDRLVTFFEAKNLTHKPKLVALTSCGEGSGVSTVAAGLAASLSETGDGNVLLVDMNVQDGAAQQFYQGNPAYGIDEALESVKREDARVQENLYVVQEAGKAESLPSILPKRFKSLVPKLKASDYDYIIFDMPPVSQISLTPRLARFMDSVLMVVEAEKTDRELVKRATTLLSESKTNVAIVLNKSHTYLPQRLVQDL